MNNSGTARQARQDPDKGLASVWVLIGLTIATAVAVAAGYSLLRTALARAERRGGIGVVV